MSDNPSAFPHVFEGALGARRLDPGMTLRDYFAGQVLSGSMNNPSYWVGHKSGDLKSTPASMAERAYAIADAMLTERSKAGAQ